MKKNLLILLFALFTQFTFAQDFWKRLEIPQEIVSLHAIASNSQGWTYFATNKGVYVTKDSGESIIPTALQHVVYNLTINERDELFAFYDDKMFYSADLGNNWTERELPIRGTAYCCISNGNTVIYGSDEEIYKSDNLGLQWTTVWETETGAFYVKALFKKSDNVLLAGMFRLTFDSKVKKSRWDDTLPGIHRSNNSGNTWYPWALQGISIVSIAENSKGYLFAACNDGYYNRGLYVSTDNGNTWNKCLSGTHVQSVVAAPNDVIYATSSYQEEEFGPIFAIVNRSFDNGVTWQRIFLTDVAEESYGVNQLLLSADGYLYVYGGQYLKPSIYRSLLPVSGAVCTLSANVNPAESGQVSGAGGYLVGETATLKATPGEGFEFVNWTSAAGTVLSDSMVYRFEMTGDINVTANFRNNTGINESWSGNFNIYPNPFVDYVHISAKNNIISFDETDMPITIHDSEGRALYKTVVKNGVIHLPHLPTGIYLLSINYKGKHIYKKMIKK